MVKLLSCSRGHFWETAEVDNGTTVQQAFCPVCGGIADTLPLLDLAPSETPETPATPTPAPPLPLRDALGWPIVAGYETEEDRGRGPTGMFSYKAKQHLVNRTVLLRVVTARDDPGQTAWGTLRAEAAALGKLHHPNIIQIHEAGERDRQIFYNVLEWIEGPTLDQELGKEPIPLRQSALLIEMLARAIHSAHQRGVIHRNLKPSSILMQTPAVEDKEHNDRGEAPPPFCRLRKKLCLPRLTDFGLGRKPIEGDLIDLDLQRGLPCYLSPEQAWGRAKEIGPSCDIYALGAILFELLAGQPPFKADSPTAVVDLIQTKEAPLPSAVAQGPFRRLARSAGDLELICRKCLRKEPRRRYASALELADDLRRYAEGRVVKAQHPGGTNADRVSRWLLRRAGRVVLGLLVLVGVIGTALHFTNNRNFKEPPQLSGPDVMAFNRLKERTREAEENLALADYARRLAQAQRYSAERAGDQRQRALEILADCPQTQRHWEHRYLEQVAQGIASVQSVGRFEQPIRCLTFSPSGRLLAVGVGSEQPQAGPGDKEHKSEVRLWDLETEQEWAPLPMSTWPIRDLAFRPDSDTLATVSPQSREGGSYVAVWHPQQLGPLWREPVFGAVLCSVRFSLDGRHLVTVDRTGTLRQYQAANGLLVGTTPNLNNQPWLPRRNFLPLALVNQDGSRVLTVTADGRNLRLVNQLRPGLQPGGMPGIPGEMQLGHGGEILGLAAYPPSNRAASCSQDGTVRLWDTQTGRELHVLNGHRGSVTAVCFSADGRRVASCGEDHTIRLWDPHTGMEICSLPCPHPDKGVPTLLAFHPHGSRLAVVVGQEVLLLGARP